MLTEPGRKDRRDEEGLRHLFLGEQMEYLSRVEAIHQHESAAHAHEVHHVCDAREMEKRRIIEHHVIREKGRPARHGQRDKHGKILERMHDTLCAPGAAAGEEIHCVIIGGAGAAADPIITAVPEQRVEEIFALSRFAAGMDICLYRIELRPDLIDQRDISAVIEQPVTADETQIIFQLLRLEHVAQRHADRAELLHSVEYLNKFFAVAEHEGHLIAAFAAEP